MKAAVTRTLVVAVLGVVVGAGTVREAMGADVMDLVGKLPSDANALVVVDAEALKKAQMAIREGWFDESMPKGEQNSVFVPRGSKQVVVATQLDDNLDVKYGVSLAEMNQPVSMDAIALAESATKEMIEDKELVTTRENVSFVRVKENRLATVFPGDRQSAARIAAGSYQGVSSSYLKGAAKNRDGAQIVMALDTFGMLSAGDVLRQMEARPVKAVEEAGIDERGFAKLMAEMNGVTLDIKVTDSINGVVTVDFGTKTDVLKGAAKPVMLEVLARVGLNVSEMSGWTFVTEGSRVRGEGKLTLFTVKRLASLVNAPSPAALDPEDKKSEGMMSADPKQRMAQASLKYYKRYAAVMDNLTQAPNLQEQVVWMRRDAKRLANLPIKDVDPELVAWGDDVTTKMNAATQKLFAGKLAVKNARNTVEAPAMSISGDYSSSSGAVKQDVANYRRNLRLETGKEYERAVTTAGEDLKGIWESRTAIRRKMAEKYSLEF